MSNKREKPELKEYTEEVQKLLLQFMISDNNIFARSRNIINPAYWTDRLRPACRYIVTFTDEYHALPTPEQILAETGVAIDTIKEMVSQHTDWFLNTIEEFCRHRAMELLIYEGPELIAKGAYSELERRTKENMMISLQKELGTDYFLNPLERLNRMKDRTGMTSTGWKQMDDKLYGGFNRGELSFFAGGPGTGKSLFLQNLALNWVQQGLNVVYISLELSEDLVGLRYDAMITTMPTKQIFKNLEDVAMRLGVIAKTSVGKSWGKLQIKKLPEAGTNANDIRAYLKEFEIQTGTKPDALVVDYLDLLHPNSGKINASDLFVKDKYTSEELRALVGEWNILGCTASQLNRASIQEQDFDPSHIAGGISKINTADNVMGIFTTAAMKERGEYQIQFLKTRSSSGVGSRIYLKFDPGSLRITDMPEGEEGYGGGGLAGITADLNRKTTMGKTVPNPSAPPQYPPSQGATGPISSLADPRNAAPPGKIQEQADRLRSLINRGRD